MKRTTMMITIAASMMIIMTDAARASDEHGSYGVFYGHWSDLRPERTNETGGRQTISAEHALAQSIRRDALRHYEMTDFELAESGTRITFHDETAMRTGARARNASHLARTIRGDALRHYEMPYFELPESGVRITFSDETAAGSEERARKADRVASERPEPDASPWEVHELTESGVTIVFPRKVNRPSEDAPMMARQEVNPMQP